MTETAVTSICIQPVENKQKDQQTRCEGGVYDRAGVAYPTKNEQHVRYKV